MGITAENVANTFKITREEQDAFALAQPEEGVGGASRRSKFDEEIVPVNGIRYDGNEQQSTFEFKRDELAAPRHHRRGPRGAQAGVLRQGRGHGRQQLAALGRRGGRARDERGQGRRRSASRGSATSARS